MAVASVSFKGGCLSEVVSDPVLRTDDKFSSSSDSEDVNLSDCEGESFSSEEHGSSSDEHIENMDSEKNDGTSSNPGWADAMSKILKTNKPRKKKTIVLSRARKLTQVAKKIKMEPRTDFEIVGEIKEEKPDITGLEEPDSKKNVAEEIRLRRKQIETKGRVKPNVLDKDREKTLSKIATKGVVQLFNAVKQHQKMIDTQVKQAGGSLRKQEKVLKSIDKRAFLDVLMGSGAKSELVDKPLKKDKTEQDIKEEEPKPAVWKVLRDDFMMGAKLKDWDKNAPKSKASDSDADSESESENDSS